MALVDDFASVLPSDSLPLLLTILQEVEELPGLEDWSPHKIDSITLNNIVSLGFPLHFVSKLSDNKEIRERVAQSIIGQKQLQPPDLAELHGCAIFSAMGAAEVKFIKRKKNVRTPDVEATWHDGKVSDIEIVSGQAKSDHVKRRNLVESILDKIDLGDRDFDIVVHCSSDMPDESSDKIVACANVIQLNETIEETGLWQVRGQRISGRGPNVIWVSGYEDSLPTWWKKGVLSSIYFRSVLGVQNETTPRPQIRFRTGLRIASYLNPVIRKASRSQKRENCFIIAFDVSLLPGAFRELGQGLDGYLCQWDHVAGVMAFEPFVSALFGKIGWRRRFFPNKYCTQVLPEKLVALERDDDKVMDVFCFLRKADEEAFYSVK